MIKFGKRVPIFSLKFDLLAIAFSQALAKSSKPFSGIYSAKTNAAARGKNAAPESNADIASLILLKSLESLAAGRHSSDLKPTAEITMKHMATIGRDVG